MLRVQYPWAGGPDVLRPALVPVPAPGAGDLLVAVRATTYNPTDTNKRSGALRVGYLREPRPYGMGMDVAGEVLATGAAVTGVRVGDRVLGMTKNGDGFAERTLVRADDAVPLDDRVTYSQGACIAMSGSTAQVLRSRVHAPPGTRVLLNGASGGIGHVLAQLLALDGYQVTGTASGAGVEALRRLGLSEVLNHRQLDPAALAGRFTAVIDLSGKMTARAGRRSLTPRGTYRTTVPGPGAVVGAVATALAARSVAPTFAVANPQASRVVQALVAADRVSLLVGTERPLATAVQLVTDIESGGLHVPGKVVLTTDGTH